MMIAVRGHFARTRSASHRPSCWPGIRIDPTTVNGDTPMKGVTPLRARQHFRICSRTRKLGPSVPIRHDPPETVARVESNTRLDRLYVAVNQWSDVHQAGASRRHGKGDVHNAPTTPGGSQLWLRGWHTGLGSQWPASGGRHQQRQRAGCDLDRRA
jgi:hypothetical protein